MSDSVSLLYYRSTFLWCSSTTDPPPMRKTSYWVYAWPPGTRSWTLGFTSCWGRRCCSECAVLSTQIDPKWQNIGPVQTGRPSVCNDHVALGLFSSSWTEINYFFHVCCEKYQLGCVIFNTSSCSGLAKPIQGCSVNKGWTEFHNIPKHLVSSLCRCYYQ